MVRVRGRRATGGSRRRAVAAIYRWEGGGPWRRIAGPLDAMPYALVAPADGELFAGLGDGTLIRSEDRGESWDPISAEAERVLALEAVAA